MNFFNDPNSRVKLIPLIIAVIGLWLLLNSPKLGSNSVSSWVRSVGGSAGSQEYLQMLKGYINAYQMVGGIFLLTGLFSLFKRK